MKPSTSSSATAGRDARFVHYLQQRCQQDRGYAARVKRADQPTGEAQLWDTLTAFHLDPADREAIWPYTLIAAAQARDDSEQHYRLPLGAALAALATDDPHNRSLQMRLQRLLVCRSGRELAQVLKPLLRYLQAQLPGELDYIGLLADLKQFSDAPQKVKARWAAQFWQAEDDAPALKQKSESACAAFVQHVLAGCQADTGYQAVLKRADNPTTEYQSWSLLGRLGVDLNDEDMRESCALIAAALARSKMEHEGDTALGRVIALSYPDGTRDLAAQTMLRHVLNCTTAAELRAVLRPLLALIRQRNKAGLCYHRLLFDLLSFSHKQEEIRQRWARDFYASAKK